MHPFVKVLILSQEFYKSKKKKNCAHLIPTQESYFKNLFVPNKVQKKKKMIRKAKRGGEKAKRKSQDCCLTFKPKNSNLEILLSADA